MNGQGDEAIICMRVTLDTCFGKLGIKEIMDFYSCFFCFLLSCREGKSEGGIKGGDTMRKDFVHGLAAPLYQREPVVTHTIRYLHPNIYKVYT